MTFRLPVVTALLSAIVLSSASAETLPPLKNDRAPENLTQMWAGFDPRSEPLETEVLKEWTEQNVTLRIVRFRIGVFKGTKAMLAAIYGFPVRAARDGTKLPALVQIHGGGQYADHRACLMNAQRGYATVSIAWAGRISAPGYRVSPAEVELFWDGKTDDPRYRVTTDWGVLDGYHAPSRNPRNVFPSARAAEWTLDRVESPRNSGWFLCALAARRALTFLERQPEVDPDRLGVYGHSMGGKLTVMTAIDPRVKAAAPSCGGISDRYNTSPLFRATIGDDVSLRAVTCPIIFLSPSNDFHGRIGDLPSAIQEIRSDDWRVTCSPHHNHQDTPEFEVATPLWFDQHLQHRFEFPQTPVTSLKLQTQDGVPVLSIQPDMSRKILSVDVFYTQQGVSGREPHENTMHRFWHHADPVQESETWTARLPLEDVQHPLWVYANVRYRLDSPVAGAGYYYRVYSASSFNVSSLVTQVAPDALVQAGVRARLKPSLLIEDFQDSWQNEWFTYRPENWARSTHKLYSRLWEAPPGAVLRLDVRADEPNTLVIVLDDSAAEVPISGGAEWQAVVLQPEDFHNHAGTALRDWSSVRRLTLCAEQLLRPGRGQSGAPRRAGGDWKGAPPQFRTLRWIVPPDGDQ